MRSRHLMRRGLRALRKPPGEILRRLRLEARHELDRFTVPQLGRRFAAPQLLQCTLAADIDALWDGIALRNAWSRDAPAMDVAGYERVCPADAERIVRAADAALAREIDLLGSGTIRLGEEIDWHRDFCTGDRWPLAYFRSIDYINKGRASDVKRVWELSRLQWLVPAGQAFALTGDEKYAACARDVIESWIDDNPFAYSVNWAVTMEPALRIVTWAFLLKCCWNSETWRDAEFRSRFLTSLFLHGVFTERYIERSDVNGNHFTADACALVVAGAVFGAGEHAARWVDDGLRELETEILRQVHPDGVDFEASTAYHRLVAELFLTAAMAAAACGRRVSAAFHDRLAKMAVFTASYLRSDGSAPLWGDADDARVLPLGPQGVSEHGYLVGLVGLYLNDAALCASASGSRAEAAWRFGIDAASRLSIRPVLPSSVSFPHGGVYVMRSDRDHVFIDCGRVGLADRGGHGHNDLLSFEAHLQGVPLVVDSGCYVYTADFGARNRFRSTGAHNTPRVDTQEINRFTAPDELWTLQPDASPEVLQWTVTPEWVLFEGGHDGYRRLNDPVGVWRTIKLDTASSVLSWSDRFACQAAHQVEIPLHLAPGVVVQVDDTPLVRLVAGGGHAFVLRWQGAGWSLRTEAAEIAPSYGRLVGVVRLVWRCVGKPQPIEFELRPTTGPALAVAGR